MPATGSNAKVGVYIDVANLSRNGGYGMRFDVLRDFACRNGASPVRLNAYVAYDAERAEQDDEFRRGQQSFHSSLRDWGFKVIEKHVRWYVDDQGRRFGKANADLDLAVDAILQSQNLDRVLLGTGDGDFVQVVRALQNRGCRVEVLAFDNVSGDLRREADLFFSGYLVPNLMAVSRSSGYAWGEAGSTVRGVCYSHPRDFGFLRFMKRVDGETWKTDTREEDSPYQSVFFHDSQLPRELRPSYLPSRDIILEVELAERPGKPGEFQARNLAWANPRRTPQAAAPQEIATPEGEAEQSAQPSAAPA